VKLWRIDRGAAIAEYWTEPGSKVAWSSNEQRVAVVSESLVYILMVENLNQEAVVATAWKHEISKMFRSKKTEFAFGCPHCRRWLATSQDELGSEKRCSYCKGLVRLNRFAIDSDWRPISKAWGE
jgi:hypothetical protein